LRSTFDPAIVENYLRQTAYLVPTINDLLSAWPA